MYYHLNISIISKYGFQMVPICESNAAISDQYASVTRSSFGATTGTVYEPLPDDYIAAREAEGKASYISPDRLVDASTCLFGTMSLWQGVDVPGSACQLVIIESCLMMPFLTSSVAIMPLTTSSVASLRATWMRFSRYTLARIVSRSPA